MDCKKEKGEIAFTYYMEWNGMEYRILAYGQALGPIGSFSAVHLLDVTA